MLVFEKEGFLEIEDRQIEELYRSRTPISLEVPGSAPFPLHAAICRHLAGTSSVCHVAFYCRPLKRALVFKVEQAPVTAAMESLMQLLQNLGFSLEQVNLSLSPALRQVVLQDIAGLLTPTEAFRQHSERQAMLAELEATLRTEAADSDAAKRASHKLSAERQLEKRAALLRNVLEGRLGSVEDASKDLRELTEKVAELTARLEQALALAAEERGHREHADGIRVAAEKRLQEVEADLVAAETSAAEGLKHKQKISRLEKRNKELQKHLAEATAALGTAQTKEVALATANRQLQEEINLLRSDLKNAVSRIEALDQELAAAGKTTVVATQAAERERLTLKKRCHALEKKLDGVTAELKEERDAHSRLLKTMAADQKRRADLEAALDDAKQQLASKQAGGKDASFAVERGQLEAALAAAKTAVQRERQVRENAEKELVESHILIDDLERAVKKLQAKDVAARHPAEKTNGKLREVEAQLEQERLEAKKLAAELAAAERRLVTLEAQGQAGRSQPAPPTAAAVAQAAAPASRKPLPHETRPPPSPGALFHPDWDLTGLPCQSPEQILQAWGSVYNVQLALEGYATQYCTAFMAVLKEGPQKRLYILFNMKKDKHILVCVPGKAPRDDAALNKLVNEAQKYLKLSGFELEKMKPADIPAYLAGYFSHPSR